MNRTKKKALDEAFPRNERDAMMTFVIENRPVLDVLHTALEYFANGGEINRHFFDKKNHLVGGHEQVQILMHLAVENGLDLEQGASLSEVVIKLPDMGLSLRVNCDVDVDSDLDSLDSERPEQPAW